MVGASPFAVEPVRSFMHGRCPCNPSRMARWIGPQLDSQSLTPLAKVPSIHLLSMSHALPLGAVMG